MYNTRCKPRSCIRNYACNFDNFRCPCPSSGTYYPQQTSFDQVLISSNYDPINNIITFTIRNSGTIVVDNTIVTITPDPFAIIHYDNINTTMGNIISGFNNFSIMSTRNNNNIIWSIGNLNVNQSATITIPIDEPTTNQDWNVSTSYNSIQGSVTNGNNIHIDQSIEYLSLDMYWSDGDVIFTVYNNGDLIASEIDVVISADPTSNLTASDINPPSGTMIIDDNNSFIWSIPILEPGSNIRLNIPQPAVYHPDEQQWLMESFTDSSYYNDSFILSLDAIRSLNLTSFYNNTDHTVTFIGTNNGEVGITNVELRVDITPVNELSDMDIYYFINNITSGFNVNQDGNLIIASLESGQFTDEFSLVLTITNAPETNWSGTLSGDNVQSVNSTTISSFISILLDIEASFDEQTNIVQFILTNNGTLSILEPKLILIPSTEDIIIDQITTNNNVTHNPDSSITITSDEELKPGENYTVTFRQLLSNNMTWAIYASGSNVNEISENINIPIIQANLNVLGSIIDDIVTFTVTNDNNVVALNPVLTIEPDTEVTIIGIDPSEGYQHIYENGIITVTSISNVYIEPFTVSFSQETTDSMSWTAIVSSDNSIDNEFILSVDKKLKDTELSLNGNISTDNIVQFILSNIGADEAVNNNLVLTPSSNSVIIDNLTVTNAISYNVDENSKVITINSNIGIGDNTIVEFTQIAGPIMTWDGVCSSENADQVQSVLSVDEILGKTSLDLTSNVETNNVITFELTNNGSFDSINNKLVLTPNNTVTIGILTITPDNIIPNIENNIITINSELLVVNNSISVSFEQTSGPIMTWEGNASSDNSDEVNVVLNIDEIIGDTELSIDVNFDKYNYITFTISNNGPFDAHNPYLTIIPTNSDITISNLTTNSSDFTANFTNNIMTIEVSEDYVLEPGISVTISFEQTSGPDMAWTGVVGSDNAVSALTTINIPNIVGQTELTLTSMDNSNTISYMVNNNGVFIANNLELDITPSDNNITINNIITNPDDLIFSIDDISKIITLDVDELDIGDTVSISFDQISGPAMSWTGLLTADNADTIQQTINIPIIIGQSSMNLLGTITPNNEVSFVVGNNGNFDILNLSVTLEPSNKSVLISDIINDGFIATVKDSIILVEIDNLKVNQLLAIVFTQGLGPNMTWSGIANATNADEVNYELEVAEIIIDANLSITGLLENNNKIVFTITNNGLFVANNVSIEISPENSDVDFSNLTVSDDLVPLVNDNIIKLDVNKFNSQDEIIISFDQTFGPEMIWTCIVTSTNAQEISDTVTANANGVTLDILSNYNTDTGTVTISTLNSGYINSLNTSIAITMPPNISGSVPHNIDGYHVTDIWSTGDITVNPVPLGQLLAPGERVTVEILLEPHPESIRFNINSRAENASIVEDFIEIPSQTILEISGNYVDNVTNFVITNIGEPDANNPIMILTPIITQGLNIPNEFSYIIEEESIVISPNDDYLLAVDQSLNVSIDQSIGDEEVDWKLAVTSDNSRLISYIVNAPEYPIYRDVDFTGNADYDKISFEITNKGNVPLNNLKLTLSPDPLVNLELNNLITGPNTIITEGPTIEYNNPLEPNDTVNVSFIQPHGPAMFWTGVITADDDFSRMITLDVDQVYIQTTALLESSMTHGNKMMFKVTNTGEYPVINYVLKLVPSIEDAINNDLEEGDITVDFLGEYDLNVTDNIITINGNILNDKEIIEVRFDQPDESYAMTWNVDFRAINLTNNPSSELEVSSKLRLGDEVSGPNASVKLYNEGSAYTSNAKIILRPSGDYSSFITITTDIDATIEPDVDNISSEIDEFTITGFELDENNNSITINFIHDDTITTELIWTVIADANNSVNEVQTTVHSLI